MSTIGKPSLFALFSPYPMLAQDNFINLSVTANFSAKQVPGTSWAILRHLSVIKAPFLVSHFTLIYATTKRIKKQALKPQQSSNQHSLQINASSSTPSVRATYRRKGTRLDIMVLPKGSWLCGDQQHSYYLHAIFKVWKFKFSFSMKGKKAKAAQREQSRIL